MTDKGTPSLPQATPLEPSKNPDELAEIIQDYTTHVKGGYVYTTKTLNYDETIKAIDRIANKRALEAAKLNRIELAKDIKHRHWANDKLRDAYLDAVIEVAKEDLKSLINPTELEPESEAV